MIISVNRAYFSHFTSLATYVLLPIVRRLIWLMQERMKGRSIGHQIDAIEQRLSNEILSRFKRFYLIVERAVTTAKFVQGNL